MQGPTSPGSIETDQSLRRAFVDRYALDSPFPDEMMQPDRSLRPHWQEFVSILDALKPEEFRQRRDLARKLIHQNGVRTMSTATRTEWTGPGAWILSLC